MKDRKKPAPEESEQIKDELDEAMQGDDGAQDAVIADEATQGAASEDEWRSALETAVQQRDEYLNMAQRVQADFQNFKRRNAQSRTDGFNDGVCETLTAILPVIDNFERAIKSADDQGDQSPLSEGIKMVYRQLLEATASMGLEEVPALGEAFDPELHNAVMRADEGEPGTVLEVFQKGYRVKGRMIRYAMVKVAAE